MFSDKGNTFGDNPRNVEGQRESDTAESAFHSAKRNKYPPRSSVQHFLVVEVPLRSSDLEIAAAVTQALASRPVPVFKNRTGKVEHPGVRTAEAAILAPAEGANTQTLDSLQNPEDSLLILVNQEGYPSAGSDT